MLLAVGIDMGIARRRQIRGVPEVALNLAQTASLVEEQGRAGVSQVVKTDLRQVAVRNPPAKVVANVLGREQLAVHIDEHIVCVCGSVSALFRSVFLDLSLATFKPLADIVRQWECAAARLGLEVVAADKLALAVNPDFSDLVPNLECAGFKVNILPAESEDLAAAQAVKGGHLNQQGVRMILGRFQQPLQLLLPVIVRNVPLLLGALHLVGGAKGSRSILTAYFSALWIIFSLAILIWAN